VPSRWRDLALAAAVVAVDQLTKAWASSHFAVPIPVVPGFLRLALSHNKGALFGAFSALGDPWRTLLLMLFPAVAILGIGYLLWRADPAERWGRLGLSLILGGAIGNVIDRAAWGHVVDFIDVYWSRPPLAGWLISTFGTNRWPTFNVADSALTVGAFLLLYELFFHHRREKKDDLAPLSD